ncbi:hypothetical protein ACSBR2_003751 [Camellia fascicularis]
MAPKALYLRHPNSPLHLLLHLGTKDIQMAVVVQFNVDQFLTKRPNISALVRESLVRVKDLNIVLDDVAITHLSYGDEFYKVRQAAIIRVEGEGEAAKLISNATTTAEMGWIELRKIEASREIAATLAKTPNVACLMQTTCCWGSILPWLAVDLDFISLVQQR